MKFTPQEIEWLHDNGKMPDWIYYQQNGKSAEENFLAQRRKILAETQQRIDAQRQRELQAQEQKQLEKKLEAEIEKQVERAIENALADLLKGFG